MPTREIRAVVEWLIDGARSAPQPQEVLAQLSERLLACGIPLWRVAVFVRTLHPNVMGRRFLWRPDAEVEVTEAPFELLETEFFRDSPIARVYRTGEVIRRTLAHPTGRYRGDPRRHLAVGHARVHCIDRQPAATGSDRPPQSLFRLPGAGDPRPWRRGAEIHGRRAPGDFCDRRRRDGNVPARPGCRTPGADEYRGSRRLGNAGAAVRPGI